MRAVVRLDVEGSREYLLRVPLYVTANLSRGGMFLITTNPLKEGTELNLRFSLPGARKPIEVIGEVLWVRDENDLSNLPPGMGIRFLRIDEEDIKQIGDFVEESANK